MVSIDVINSDLKNMLSCYRYQHSLNVADVAKRLAITYQFDEEKAYLAGLLHDIAKEFSTEESIFMLRRNGIEDIDINSRVIHSVVGAYVALEKYGIDEDVFHAIACHTLGDVPMNLLDKIVFVADKIEPGKNYDGIEEEREVALRNIDEAMILCIENNHKKLISQGRKIHKKSVEVLNYLKKNTDV